MNRRDALASLLALGTAFTPPQVRAQTPRSTKARRIGFLPDFHFRAYPWFADDMRELGWTEGRDYVPLRLGIEMAPDQIESGAARMMAQKPDLIFAANTAYALAALRLTKTVPVVMLSGGYPVEAGLADSLARPGKNVTGNTSYAGYDIWGKLIELLREAKPNVKRIGVLFGYVPPMHPREESAPFYSEMRRTERALGVQIRIGEVDHVDQVMPALLELHKEGSDALLFTSGLPIWLQRQRVAQFAVERRLPTIADYIWPDAEPYPLLIYSPSPRDLMHRAVSYIDRILKGAKPGDLPIEQPTKFELVVNMNTAKALGLKIPQSVLLRATRVIE